MDTTPPGATPWATEPSNPLGDIRAGLAAIEAERRRDKRADSLWKYITGWRLGMVECSEVQDFLCHLAEARSDELDLRVLGILRAVPNPPMDPSSYLLLVHAMRADAKRFAALERAERAELIQLDADKLKEALRARETEPRSLNRHERRAAAAQARRAR